MVSASIEGSIMVSVKSLQISTQMGKDTHGLKLSFQWNWETWVTCQAHDRGGQPPNGLWGEFFSGRQSLTTILNCFGSCMVSFQMPVCPFLNRLCPFRNSESGKNCNNHPSFCSKINIKCMMRKDIIIMTWVLNSKFSLLSLLIRREGLLRKKPHPDVIVIYL